MNSERTRKLTALAMLSALAFIVMVVGRIPMMSIPGLTLKYDPKDVVIIIGGFMYGPLAAAGISAVVSFVEMVTVSDNGPIGMVMNIVSSCSFACTAAFVYKYRRTLSGALAGIVGGVIVTAAAMVLWNYLITPIYLGFPRAAVVPYLMPFFLPFNLIKGTINAAVTMMLYKPVSRALRMITRETFKEEKKAVNNLAVAIVAAVVVLACVVLVYLVF